MSVALWKDKSPNMLSVNLQHFYAPLEHFRADTSL